MTTSEPRDTPGHSPHELWIPLLIALFHLLTAAGYGWFRDELYYLASTEHLAWGYVDHPPASIALLALVRAIFGDSILVVRAIPALATGAAVFLVGSTARRLGAGSPGVMVAQLAMGLAPVGLSLATIYSMNALDVLAWAAAIRLLTGLLDGDPPRNDSERDLVRRVRESNGFATV